MNPSELPNEILTSIFINVPTKDLYACLAVCKRWLLASQMILYKEIAIDIGFTDNIFETLIFDTLVNSTYMPGRWVKTITVTRLKVPDNLFLLDPKRDPLHLLMTHCPGVEEFYFNRVNYIFQSEWQYLQRVLEQRNDGWKLRNLAKHFDKEDYNSYYSCSLLMKDTLRHYYLKKKQNNYGIHFKPFYRLTTLSISTRVINDIVESDKILEHLPQLINLEVEFYVPKPQQVQRYQLEYIKNSTSYSHIKDLQLKNLPLSRNEELLFIMQKFNGLRTINLKLAKGKPWPIIKLSTIVLQDFFRYLTKIQDHSISFRNIDNMAVLNNYFIGQENHDGYFHMSFTNMLDEGENATSLLISSQEGIVLTYNLVKSSFATRIKKANSALFNINQYIRHLHISLLGKHKIAKQITEFLPLIFGSCLGLNALTISSGDLFEMIPKSIHKNLNIHNLTFNKCNLDIMNFNEFMNIFPTIDLLQINNCNFITDDYTDNATNTLLNMSQTKFNTIRISYQEIGLPGVPLKKQDEFGDPLIPIENNDVFIIINLYRDQETKYYCCDTTVKNGIKSVDNSNYYKLLYQAQNSEKYHLNIFTLNVKSLKAFSLVTPNTYFSVTI